MKALQWMVKVALLLLILAPDSWEMEVEDTAREPRGHAACQSKQSHSEASDFKRHVEGTFTSDYTRYLDKIKAKDFVHWLITTNRESAQRFVRGTTNYAASPLGLASSRFDTQSFRNWKSHFSRTYWHRLLTSPPLFPTRTH
ncbi:exendin-4-like [Polyodon spathula]|uniref:exendin-4-like n=1 Tax=Polyodon spathula TaxID=7913 RepID=UPI001B7E680E|nr:exendin-4-like [Polyodon spathula]